MVSFAIDMEFVPPARIVGEQFSDIAKGFRTFRVPLEASVRQVMIPSILQNFMEGGRPPWQPLMSSTEERRSRQGTLGGFPQDILVESGRLMGAAGALARWTIHRDFAAFTNLPNAAEYGWFHQFGAGSPERPFVVMQDEDRVAIHGIFHRWVGGIVVQNWVRRTRRL